jgi:hypothetical protein
MLLTDAFRSNVAVSRWRDAVWLAWLAAPLYWIHQLEEYSLPVLGFDYNLPDMVAKNIGFPPYPECPVPMDLVGYGAATEDYHQRLQAITELGSPCEYDMSLPQDFWDQLPLKTDAELYDVLAHPGDYLPEAVAAAKEELHKRNLTPEKIAHLEATVQSQNVAAETKAQERLSWPMRIFIFIFCVSLAGILLAVYYQNNGYKKKASDCWITLGISVAFHLIVGLLLASMR